MGRGVGDKQYISWPSMRENAKWQTVRKGKKKTDAGEMIKISRGLGARYLKAYMVKKKKKNHKILHTTVFKEINAKIWILRFVVTHYKNHNLSNEVRFTFFDLSRSPPVQINLQHQIETMTGTERGCCENEAYAEMRAGAKFSSLRRE